MMAFRRKMSEAKETTVHVDIDRAGAIAEQLQGFFSEKNITPMDAMASMMILTEFLKRQLKILPEDYNHLLEMLSKVK